MKWNEVRTAKTRRTKPLKYLPAGIAGLVRQGFVHRSLSTKWMRHTEVAGLSLKNKGSATSFLQN